MCTSQHLVPIDHARYLGDRSAVEIKDRAKGYKALRLQHTHVIEGELEHSRLFLVHRRFSK